MKIMDLRSKPQLMLAILILFLFYLSAITHLEILLAWLFIIIMCILIFSKEKVRNLKSIFGVLPFIIMVLLPFFLNGFLWHSIAQKEFSERLILRLMCTIMTVSFISSHYSYLYLVEGAMNLGFPNFLSQIISLTFRYFFMIREDIDKMSKAMTARNFTNASIFIKLPVYGKIIGGFFLKASDHSEKVYNAMRNRGFNSKSKFKAEKLTSVNNLVVISLFIILFIGLTIFDKFAEVKWLL